MRNPVTTPVASPAASAPQPSPETLAEFEALWRAHETRAFRYAFRLTGKRQDAEDLTQEAAERAWITFDRYDRSQPFLRWLHRLIYCRHVDRLRRSHLDLVSIDSGIYDHAVNAALGEAYSERDPARVCEAGMMTQPGLRAAWANLREEERLVVRQTADGYTCQEIAARLGLTPGQVRKRLERTRATMRQALLDIERPQGLGLLDGAATHPTQGEAA